MILRRHPYMKNKTLLPFSDAKNIIICAIFITNRMLQILIFIIF